MDMVVGKLPLLLLIVAAMVITIGCATATMVTHLKGFDGPLPFSLETGYIEVDKTHGVELFYYYFQSEHNPAEDPVILWIAGGPGCSGLNDILLQHGPMTLDIAGYAAAGEGGFPGLLYRPDTWTKVSNIIYVDAPVGAGFSYTRDPEGLNVTLTGLGRQLRVFLHKWMEQHPELASNQLYIGGGSYSGYIVTDTMLEVANDPGTRNGKPPLNLVGYILGNARGEVNIDNAGKLPSMHGMGLISDELYMAALTSCAVGRNKQCSEAQQAIREVTADINVIHILEPTCGEDLAPKGPDLRLSLTPMQLQLQVEKTSHVDVVFPLECHINSYQVSNLWANDDEVKEMLGVRKDTIVDGSWVLCPMVMPNFHNDVPSTIPYHHELTQRGYRALVYNGDHDLVVSYRSTHAWIRSLGYPVVAPWRPWYSKREVAGFTTEYAYNLTFVTVMGAGHVAPQNRPRQCFDMFQRWISPAGKI